MISTSQLIERSKTIFSNLEEVNVNLFKGILPIEDKVAGIFYLNFNTEVSENDFEDIQYKYLAEEFYNQVDSLQWNIYLLFINSSVNDDLKIKILTDDKYARKLIFTGKEFLDFFELEKSEQVELPDIVSNWKHELNNVGLQELYSSTSNEGVLRNFLRNDVPKLVEERSERNLENVPIIEKISSITLNEDYRHFPLIREYQFGLVNLFTGSNGVGKTSLMESIELVLTGKTQRNKNSNEITNSITAVYNDHIPDSYNHNNNYYKERGAKWYKRRLSEQGNKTFESFNQFNFFNTDAASLFSNSDHKDLINESLKQIILGEEYTILKDRIEKLEIKLRTELNKTKKEIVDKNNIVQNNLNRIDELRTDKNFEGLKGGIKQNISALGYKSLIPESDYSSSNLFVNEIKNEIDFILSNEWVTSFKRFSEVKDSVSKRTELVFAKKEIIQSNNEEVIKIQKENQELKSEEIKLTKIIKYFEIEDTSNIDTLEVSLSKIDVQLSIIKTLKDLINLELDILNLREENKTLIEIITDKERAIFTNSELLKNLQSEVKAIQDNFSLIEKLTSQIKLLGQEILSHNNHTNNCPLCEQTISHSELSQKLQFDFSQNIDKSILNEKNTKVENLRKEVLVLQVELKNLQSYNSTIANYLKDHEDLSFNQIEITINETVGKELGLLKEKNNLENLKLKVDSIGGSSSEFLQLKEELSRQYVGEIVFDKVLLNDRISRLRENITSNSLLIERFLKSNADIINELNSTLKLKEYIDNIDKIEVYVKSNETKINSLNFSFENLNRYLIIPFEKPILDLSKQLNLLSENIETFRLIENNHNEIKKLLSEIEKINTELPKIKDLNNRLDKATKTLSKLSSNSEDLVLEDYFTQNLSEIKDIFQTIHSPKEFTDIKYQENTLILFKGDDDHQISEISTGQRAALVLSIFISLNRKLKNGPNILVFDDPVTFIDDFNALSFLDFLRYFIVKEKKQIFFATANKKFSTLFKKKFEFLGEGGFREFHMAR